MCVCVCGVCACLCVYVSLCVCVCLCVILIIVKSNAPLTGIGNCESIVYKTVLRHRKWSHGKFV